MNEKKIQKLFEAARKQQPSAPAANFDADVMRAISREQSAGPKDTVSLRASLSALFPRVAWAAAFIIVACVAGDYFFAPRDSMGLTDEMTQVSEQWLFVEEGF